MCIRDSPKIDENISDFFSKFLEKCWNTYDGAGRRGSNWYQMKEQNLGIILIGEPASDSLRQAS